MSGNSPELCREWRRGILQSLRHGRIRDGDADQVKGMDLWLLFITRILSAKQRAVNQYFRGVPNWKGEEMMDDLISRNTLKEEIESLTVRITGLRSGKGALAEFMREYKNSVLRIIDEQPIAFNLDAAVERANRREQI